MDIYRLLKLNNAIKSHRIKFFGLWILNIFNKRYLSIQFDPVLACNLRCTMCYFSDSEFVKKNMKGIFKEEEIEKIAAVNFKNALKLQIGCGAEPTLFKHNTALIKTAKLYKVPYISMITNGNLLTEQDVENFSNAGLNEFVFSMHGVNKSSYEKFMEKGDFEKFNTALRYVSTEKIKNKNLKLRINYTFNEDNFDELNNFFDNFNHLEIDTIQLRPIDKIGESSYNNFNLSMIENQYDALLEFFKAECQTRKIMLLAPDSIKRNEIESFVVESQNNSSYLLPYTYCYVSPNYFWKDNFEWKTQGFSDWKKQNGWHSELFFNIFKSRKHFDEPNRNMLNYGLS